MSSSAVPLEDVSVTTESTRRALSSRQARTVEKLVAAAVDEVRVAGFDGLSIRNVARRAGVAPATAYNYFASREHLVTEVFWRRLAELPETRIDGRRGAAARVADTLGDLALLVADEPELAAACTTAMLSSDPDVKLLRDRIGLEMRRRLARALGDHGSPTTLATLEMLISGALVHAGTGHLSYTDLPRRLGDAARLVVGTGR